MGSLLLTVALAALDGACPPVAAPAAREEAYVGYVTGQIHANEGRFAEALEPLQGALRADPLLAQARYALGQALVGLRRFPEAAEAFEACREVFRCLSALGSDERREMSQRLDRSINEMQQAILSLQRGDQVGRQMLWKELNNTASRTPAETTRLVRQLEESLAELVRWKKRGLDPRPPAAVSVALGTALFQAGRTSDAEREFRAALELDPKHGDAHYNLAVTCLATGRLAEAEAELKLAAKAGITVSPALRQALDQRKAEVR
jgi:protein O-GlcNAc transferase